VNVAHAPGVAVRVTTEPVLSSAAQPSLLPDVQAMPGPVTVPVPVPAVVTVRRYVVGWNVAVTVFADDIVTVQVLPFVLVQPVQLFSMASAAGDAVSVTVLPLARVVVQPAGSLHSSPAPLIVPVAPYSEAGFTVRGYVLGWKMAVTVFAAVMATVHVAPFTVVQPVQLFRIELASGVPVRVTVAPFAMGAVQPSVDPAAQSMPGPVTVPLPPCATALTVSANVLGAKVAVTDLAEVIATVHVAPFTEVQPAQLLRIELASGMAVRVTVAPFAMLALQPSVDSVVQAMPGPVTVPTPPDDVAAFTVSTNVLGTKVAVTVLAEAIVTVQVAAFVVVHPVQLLNSDVAFGTAVSVIVAPFGSMYVHPSAALQSIPSP
jgi:hypothetical protein